MSLSVQDSSATAPPTTASAIKSDYWLSDNIHKKMINCVYKVDVSGELCSRLLLMKWFLGLTHPTVDKQ